MLPTSTLIRLFGTTLRLSRHDRWTPEQLRAHQAHSLHRLRRYAYRYSPFYQRVHAGDFDAPLEALPVLTSRDLGAELESMLIPAGGTRRRECRTSGTAGEHVRRCVYDARAWRTVLASFARARAWAGVPVRPWPRVRMAVVASGSPVHQSGAVAAALDNWWAPTLSLDAGAPLEVPPTPVTPTRVRDVGFGIAGSSAEMHVTCRSMHAFAAAVQHAALSPAPRTPVSGSRTAARPLLFGNGVKAVAGQHG